MEVIVMILPFPFLQEQLLCIFLEALVAADTFEFSFEETLFCSHAFYFATSAVGFITLPIVVFIIIFLMFLSPPGNFFSTVLITACAFVARSSSDIVSSPILHAKESEFLSLTLIDDLNLSKIDSIGALNGSGVGIFPLGPINCPRVLPTFAISVVSARKKSL